MALFDRLDWSSNAVATTVSGAISGTGAITPSIAAFTGWPDGSDGPFDILVGGVEIMRVTSRSSGVLTIASGGRGMFGTSAATHASGVTAIYVCTGNTLDEFNRICSIVGNGTVNLPMVGGGAAAVPAFAALTATGIATDAVTTAKILASNVTTAKIADANVTADSFAAAVAGSGLTGGAGTALAVGAGHGLDVTADAVDVDETELDHALIGGTDPAIAKTLLTTRGDMIRRSATAPEKFALGTLGQVLTSDGTDAVWATPTSTDNGGDLKMGVWVAAQTGYALMNGQTVNSVQSLYPETWANAPTGWRSGANLVLPDWRGLMPVMLKPTDADFDAIGDTGGEKTHTLTTPEMPAHAHTTPGKTSANAGANANFMNSTGTTDNNVSSSTVGGGGAHNNMPPFVTVNWAIRLK